MYVSSEGSDESAPEPSLLNNMISGKANEIILHLLHMAKAILKLFSC